VEDDEEVCATTADTLMELGYDVLKANDADSALTVIESGAPIDILFMDVVMPGRLRSVELARIAQRKLPRIAVLFTSGYTDPAMLRGALLDEGTNVINKPYTREEVANKLRQILRKPD
jgi:CheY-like chemotaxis protein